MTETKVGLMEAAVLYSKARRVMEAIQRVDPSHILRKYPRTHELFEALAEADRAKPGGSFNCADILEYIKETDKFICALISSQQFTLAEFPKEIAGRMLPIAKRPQEFAETES